MIQAAGARELECLYRDKDRKLEALQYVAALRWVGGLECCFGFVRYIVYVPS